MRPTRPADRSDMVWDPGWCSSDVVWDPGWCSSDVLWDPGWAEKENRDAVRSQEAYIAATSTYLE